MCARARARVGAYVPIPTPQKVDGPADTEMPDAVDPQIPQQVCALVDGLVH